MRFIDPPMVGQNLPAGWNNLADMATNDVAAAQPQDRSNEVDSRSSVWKALKGALKSASHDKCWYCESIDIRSDNAVDHYRPKNAVVESPAHGGYWWLAFKWENYRFSCTFCNSRRVDQKAGQSGGKSYHFPLNNEAHRAKTPADDLYNEEPMLLDPFVASDPGHLWFDESGHVAPHPFCNGSSSYPFKRAEASIQLYHLNHSDIVDQRKALCSGLRRRVEDADRYFKRYSEGDDTAKGAFADAVSDLRTKVSTKAPYSAAARSMLMGLRGTHPFVDAVLAAT